MKLEFQDHCKYNNIFFILQEGSSVCTKACIRYNDLKDEGKILIPYIPCPYLNNHRERFYKKNILFVHIKKIPFQQLN